MIRDTTKLTFDTDDGRYNPESSFIKLPTGQKVIFYKKYLTSGRTSDSRVTFSVPFDISVEAGSGELNGNNVSWGATNLTAISNKFNYVYVDMSGTVNITDDFPMTLSKVSIILAFINVGLDTIVYVEEIEKDGRYIYARRQVLDDNVWVWDDYEFVLCTGEKPNCFYDADSDKIYLTYQKNSAVFIRLFDVEQESTWNYLRNVNIITGDIITLSNDPTVTTMNTVDSCDRGNFTLEDEPTAIPFLSYTYVDHIDGLRSESGGTYTHLLRMPFVDFGANNDDIYNLTLEIYRYDGSNWILEVEKALYDYSRRNESDLWEEDIAIKGEKKRMYVRFYTTYFTRYGGLPKYMRLPYDADYNSSPVEDFFNQIQDGYYVDDDGNYVVKIFEPLIGTGTVGIKGKVDFAERGDITKTYEYEETRSLHDETVDSFIDLSGSDLSITEYEGISGNQEETVNNFIDVSSKAFMEISS